MPTSLLLACPIALVPQHAPQGSWHAASRFDVPPGGVSVPLDDWGGRPVVEVRSGERTLRLILDTGTSAVLVLGTGAPDVTELRLGEARLANPPITRLEFAMTPAGSNEHIDGIMGLPAFEGHLVVLDLDERRLEIADGTLPSDAAGVIPFRLDGGMGGIPTIALKAGGVSIEAHLDTGSPGVLLVPTDVAVLLPQSGTPRRVGLARTPMGDAEISEVDLAGAIEVGPLRIEKARLRIGDLPQIAGRGLGNVGTALFGRSRLTFDLASQRVRIEKRVEPGDELRKTPPREATREAGAEPDLAILLARMSGDFDITARLRVGAGDEFREITGVASWSSASVGRWQREDFTLDDAERGRLSGTLFFGPTGAPGFFELVQLDGFHPSAVHVWGRWIPAERALVLDTVIPRDPPADLAPAPTRWCYRLLGSAGFVKETHCLGPDGRYKLESTYRYVPRS